MSRNNITWDVPTSMPNTYRVVLLEDKNSIEVTCLGMNCIDSDCEGIYDLSDGVYGVPQWLEEKLSVLMLCDPTLPFNSVPIDDVGVRIDEHTFWVER
jgi:hypothetical protein